MYLGDICLLGVISAERLIEWAYRLVLNVTEMFDYECLQEIKLQTLCTTLRRCLHLIQRKLNVKGEFDISLSVYAVKQNKDNFRTK